MYLTNTSKMQVAYNVSRLQDASKSLTIVSKGTFTIPSKKGELPKLLAQSSQIEVFDKDESIGEPGYSALLYENDFAFHKPLCDVLLQGSAYAPNKQATNRVPVRLKIDNGSKNLLDKRFTVTGERSWEWTLLSLGPGKAKMFIKQPFHYGNAFGGMYKPDDEDEQVNYYAANPVGTGYFKSSLHAPTENIPIPMPVTEEIDNPIRSANGKYIPMAFGPCGRNFKHRYPLAGTYDKNWENNIAPDLPADFDDRYFQCASPDQQIPYLKGGEQITLKNLTPQSETTFPVPNVNLGIVVVDNQMQRSYPVPKIDTLFLYPDEGIFTLTWRASHPIKLNVFEIEEIVVGRVTKAWWLAKIKNKEYNPHLLSNNEAVF